MEEKKIDFARIEKKWQSEWEKKKAFVVSEKSKKKKYYVLEMYPYPSASYLHMGHVRNYTIGDVYARFKRMKGFNVLYPMGYDSFGLPAENAAKKEGIHPEKYADKAIKQIMKYQKALGNSYDWSRVLWSHDPDYYKWNQYFFIELYKKGLVYRGKAGVNWCESCESVLANEESEGGKCWRCGSDVVQKDLEQWFLKTTAYADELLSGLDKINWFERIKTMQRNWIGRSEGTEIDFSVNEETWKVFTTRADTLMGVTFMVVSAEHPKLWDLVTEEQKKEVSDFIKRSKKAKDGDDLLEKDGVFTGSYAKHPLTGEKVPVWAGNFVVADYGSGMVMAVPAHDARDFEFAKKYGIDIKRVIKAEGEKNTEKLDEAFTKYGVLVNSEGFDGLKSEEAKEHIVNALQMKKKGRKTVNYKIRDWLISRQRFWGTPIPMIHCEKCGVVPVNEKDLPVKIPDKVDFKSKENPLKSDKKFLEVKCPNCSGKAERETDTMGGFFDSSWYFLRFCSPDEKKKAFDAKKVKYWMPVDQYVGGAEHAVMHLIYARFFTKALRDLGLIDIDEPFMNLFNQGIVYKDGAKMSKSKGNVVYQTDISEKYGIDTARLFLMSVASPEKQMEWSDEGVIGSYRTIKRLFSLSENLKSKVDKKEEHKVNLTIKKVTECIESFDYPGAVVAITGLMDSLSDGISKNGFSVLLRLISPFTPHITEELWEKIGGKGLISLSDWPEFDEKKIDENIEKAEEAVEKTFGDIQNILRIVKEKEGKEGKKVYIYTIPPEKGNYDSEELKKRLGLDVEVYASNDARVKSGEADPEGKAKKSRPGKPGIYIE